MAKSPRKVAEETLPGWKVARGEATVGAKADARAPSLTAFRKAYGLQTKPRAADGLSGASFGQGDVEFLVMEPPAAQSAVGRKVVVVANGKAIAVQG